MKNAKAVRVRHQMALGVEVVLLWRVSALQARGHASLNIYPLGRSEYRCKLSRVLSSQEDVQFLPRHYLIVTPDFDCRQ